MLKPALFCTPLLTAALPIAALLAAPADARPLPLPLARAAMVHPDGSPAGRVTLARRYGHLLLVVDLAGLPPGEHGLHFHAVGTCEGPDFKSAGGHLNPEGHQHGMLNPMGSHLGDLPNFIADAQGHAQLQIALDQLPDKLLPHLFDADGTAIVVHAAADDYRTDPSGNSGARIACGVLRKP
ncbi:MAG TPA: superoxide dismutase family protein [Novosphingobium sp.]|nr:superoxide dismutase family protein [Novosphingobium sp.]HZV09867.1 superoxide dismutase family protein [Novosphingobium sp.]